MNTPNPLTISQLFERLVTVCEQVTAACEQVTAAYQQNNKLLEKLIDERSPKPKLMRSSQAWKELGYRDYQQCYRKIQTGHYRVGHEVSDRRTPGAVNPEYWLDIEACKKRDTTIPAKRK